MNAYLVDEEVLRQVLYALQPVNPNNRLEMIETLRTILASPPAEPVAWIHNQRQDSDVITAKVKHVWGGVAVGKEAQYTIPLYRKDA
jgi:hypothetical protein